MCVSFVQGWSWNGTWKIHYKYALLFKLKKNHLQHFKISKLDTKSELPPSLKKVKPQRFHPPQYWESNRAEYLSLQIAGAFLLACSILGARPAQGLCIRYASPRSAIRTKVLALHSWCRTPKSSAHPGESKTGAFRCVCRLVYVWLFYYHNYILLKNS
jgi:hypothetical protein